MSNIALLEKTMCVHLQVTLWSGRRRLRAEDLGDAARQLPPEDLASLGSLKLCDPEKLAKLSSIKRAAERVCGRVCVRFLGGYATEAAQIPALIEKLEVRKSEFDTEARVFSAGLQSEIDDWIAKHPQWGEVIRRALPDMSYVTGRLNFEYQVYRVGTASDEDGAALNRGLTTAANGLTGQLFQEIQTEARLTWSRSYEGKDVVTQKALRPIRTIRDKLVALAFLDPRIDPVIDQINDVLAELPKQGKLNGKDLSSLFGLLHLLTDADRMLGHSRRLAGDTQARRPPTAESPSEAATAAKDGADVASGGDDNDETTTDGSESALPRVQPEEAKHPVFWF